MVDGDKKELVLTTDRAVDPLLGSDETTQHQAAFYREREVAMRRLGYLLVGSTAIADELVHDAFEQVMRRWVDIEHRSAYLRLAVINGARSWGRRRQTPPRPIDDTTAPLDPDAIAVRDALAGLRYSEREAIVLRYYAGLTDVEIADQTNRPIGTVKSNIHRGLRRLRRELANDWEV